MNPALSLSSPARAWCQRSYQLQFPVTSSQLGFISSELPVRSYQLSGVLTHPSPKPTALMEAPLALKPLLEVTPHKPCSQEDTSHWRIACIKLWLHFS